MPSFWSLDVDGLIVFKRWVVFSGFPSGILGWFLGLLLIDLPGLESLSAALWKTCPFFSPIGTLLFSLLILLVHNIYSCKIYMDLNSALELPSESHSVMSSSLWSAPMSIELFRWEYWSGSHFLLQGNVLTQRLNLGFPHCRQILYHLSHQGRPNLDLSSAP